MRAILVLLVTAAVGSARVPQRIVGGTLTTIDEYPFGVAMIYSRTGTGTFTQFCGGTILNNRAILTAAHCLLYYSPIQWRSRVGSTYSNSGGTVYISGQFIIHPNYVPSIEDRDIGIVHIVGTFSFSDTVRPGTIAGTNYNLRDNEEVWAIGWGRQWILGPLSEELRHVKLLTVNQDICKERYGTLTENMLCAGWLDVGGRDQCQGDSGSPLLHNNVVVGICSWGIGCASPIYPGVNTRVTRFTDWILEHA